MRPLSKSVLALFLLVAPCLSQEVPLTLKGDTAVVQVDKVIVTKEDRTVVKSFPLFVIAPSDVGFYYWSYPAAVKASDKGNVLQVDSAPKGDLKVELKVQSAVYDEAAKKIKYVTQFASITVAIGEVPQPPIPPEPKPPEPKPPEPKPPIPVSSFRVIFVWESGKTLPIGQVAVMDAKVVRDYLTLNCTPEGGYAGWRKYDKDQDAGKDQPTIAAMWKATQPSVTTVPCVAIEVNGKVDIVPLAATPESMVDTFKKYKSGGGN